MDRYAIFVDAGYFFAQKLQRQPTTFRFFALTGTTPCQAHVFPWNNPRLPC